MSKPNKAALILYPAFCHYEIALAVATLNLCGTPVESFSVSRTPVRCEEGLTLLPDKAFDEFDPEVFGCVLLPGLGMDPNDAAFGPVVDFLVKLKGREDMLFAAISLSPVLLAKAGLLRGRKFCVGMYEEDRDEFDCFEWENQQRAPLVSDGNVITAMGMAFREFAIETTRKLGNECRNDLWNEVKYPVAPEDYIFHCGG